MIDIAYLSIKITNIRRCDERKKAYQDASIENQDIVHA